MIRIPAPQTEYDRALDLERWRNLGVPLHKREEPIATMRQCRALVGKHQCQHVARFPWDSPLYCLVHHRKFMEVVSSTTEKEDGE